jgi:phage terminase large subunit
LIGRDELKKLKQTTLLTFFEVIHSLGLRDEIKYNEPMGMIYFKKQDVHIFLVDLSYQPSDPKYNRLGSYSLTGYFIDEAQEVRKDAIDILRARTSLLSGTDDE